MAHRRRRFYATQKIEFVGIGQQRPDSSLNKRLIRNYNYSQHMRPRANGSLQWRATRFKASPNRGYNWIRQRSTYDFIIDAKRFKGRNVKSDVL